MVHNTEKLRRMKCEKKTFRLESKVVIDDANFGKMTEWKPDFREVEKMDCEETGSNQTHEHLPIQS